MGGLRRFFLTYLHHPLFDIVSASIFPRNGASFMLLSHLRDPSLPQSMMLNPLLVARTKVAAEEDYLVKRRKRRTLLLQQMIQPPLQQSFPVLPISVVVEQQEEEDISCSMNQSRM